MKELTLTEMRAMGVTLKIKGSTRMSRENLVKEICKLKGWENEKPEIQEFLIAGGEIKKLPASTLPAPKPTGAQATQTEKKRTPRKIERKVKKESKRKVPEGSVSLADLCTEMGVEGRVARRKLRGSDVKKPEGGQWVWSKDSADLKKVRELLK